MIRLLAGLLALAPLAPAADPGAAAVRFLEDLRAGEVDLQSRTALSADATREKAASIRQRLRQLGDRLRLGELKVVEQHTDDGLAAVLISQVPDLDSSAAQIHAIGLLRRDDTWLPAPVPASFENTGISYHPDLGPAAARLEDWMLRQRPVQLDQLRQSIDATLLARVRDALAPDVLLKETPEQIVGRFLDACRQRDLPTAAALVGALEDPRPEGWQDPVSQLASRFRAAAEDPDNPPMVLDPQVLAAPILFTGNPRDTAGVVASIGYFDPRDRRTGDRAIAIHHLRLRRSPSGSWRVEVPAWLGGSAGAPPFTESETVLRRAFPLALFKEVGTQAFATPEELGEATMRAFVGQDFQPLLRLFQVDDETSAAEALVRMARRWSKLQSNGNLCFLLDHRIDGDHACGIYAEIDPYRPEINENLILPLAMVRIDGGWHLADDPEALTEPLRDWFATARQDVGENWLDRIGLKQRLGGLPPGPAPDAEAARRTAEAWIGSLQARAPRRILEQTALFDDIRSVRRLFSFIGQEFPNTSPREILGVHRNGRWAAASIRHQPPAGGDDPALDLLHPIIGTSSGPRMLPEAILYLPDTRPRRFLNNEVWKRLGERLPDPAIEELRKLLEAHTALCRPEQDSDPATDE